MLVWQWWVHQGDYVQCCPSGQDGSELMHPVSKFVAMPTPATPRSQGGMGNGGAAPACAWGDEDKQEGRLVVAICVGHCRLFVWFASWLTYVQVRIHPQHKIGDCICSLSDHGGDAWVGWRSMVRCRCGNSIATWCRGVVMPVLGRTAAVACAEGQTSCRCTIGINRLLWWAAMDTDVQGSTTSLCARHQFMHVWRLEQHPSQVLKCCQPEPMSPFSSVARTKPPSRSKEEKRDGHWSCKERKTAGRSDMLWIRHDSSIIFSVFFFILFIFQY